MTDWRTFFIGPAIMICLTSCSRGLPPPPAPELPGVENLLEPFLQDGVPAQLQSFSNPLDGYQFGIAEGGYEGNLSLLVDGTGQYGGVNTPPIPLEGRKTYIAAVFTVAERGQILLKMDYLQDGEHLGSTNSLSARQNVAGWQQLVVLSQRSKYPQATHVRVVAVCRGDARARLDSFSLSVP